MGGHEAAPQATPPFSSVPHDAGWNLNKTSGQGWASGMEKPAQRGQGGRGSQFATGKLEGPAHETPPCWNLPPRLQRVGLGDSLLGSRGLSEQRTGGAPGSVQLVGKIQRK